MKLCEIPRTATFAWSHGALPQTLLATGTVSGALDETFSNVGQLEIWEPVQFHSDSPSSQPQPRGTISTNARFNRLAWSAPTATQGSGVIASGMETGEVSIWDVDKILAGSSSEEALVFNNTTHTGPVRGLDFNPIQKTLFASGATNAELQVYDLANPTKSHATGPKSNKLDEITSLQWNPIVPHILASSSSSGFTSVWDLKAKKEVISLAYGGGAATGMGNRTGGGVNLGAMGSGMQIGSRRGMSDVCWHPENSTRVITSSEDDTSPIVMLWDLRNSRAPEKILSGHEKGVLSVSWCKQDSDLLLSCGKDNRTICWNPQTCEIVGELPSSQNWSFQTSWCPRNPDLLATASFDGTIGVHSLQMTHEPADENKSTGRAKDDSASTVDDIFGGGTGISSSDDSNSTPVLSLKQAPKWLRRPVSATFGFGGQLVSTSNLPAASGKHQSGVVHLRQVVTEEDVIARARALAASDGSAEELRAFCDQRASRSDADANPLAQAEWKALRTLFTTNSRDELVSLLGFSKAEIERQVAEAIKNFSPSMGDKEDGVEPGTPRDPAVTFADKPEELSETPVPGQGQAGGFALSETTPSEVSAATDTTKKTEADTEMTEQSLFGAEEGEGSNLGMPNTDAQGGADFFSSMGTTRNAAVPDRMVVPHQSVPKDSSVAATIGSRASSVISENLKSNTFKIYPTDESEVDRLITRALVLGDFDSAVTLSLSVDRFADALILAVKGGPELLAKTQQAYFEKRTTSLPYLRLFQSIVSNDLSDVVQNADLSEWQEVFVVLCTFAKADEFNGLAEQLGQRLEYQYRVATNSEAGSSLSRAKEFKQNALLCYLAAGRLERVVNIWVDEMRDEEEQAVKSIQESKGADTKASRYSIHASALQTFMEKVAIFKSATGYVDLSLADTTRSSAVAASGARTYQLAALYDRYYEYADLLATQGLVDLAVKYVKQTPTDYQGSQGDHRGLIAARQRYLNAAGVNSRSAAGTAASASSHKAQPQSYQGYASTPYQQPSIYTPAAPAVTQQQPSYAPPPNPQQQQQQSTTSNAYNPSPYGAPQPQNTGYGSNQYPSNAYNPSASGNYGQAPAPAGNLPPPPRSRPQDHGPAIIPAALRRDIPGWNDAPSSAAKRPGSATGNKPQPITSPFPHSTPAVAQPQTQNGLPPPPPRGSSAASNLPAPPRGPPVGSRQQQQQQPMPPPVARTPGPPPPGRAGPPPGAIVGPPPPRALTPQGVQQSRVVSPPVQNQPRPPSTNPYMSQHAAPLSPRQSFAQQQVNNPYGAQQQQAPPGPISPPSQAATPAPAAKLESAAPKYPRGDRSHIPLESQPIYQALANEIGRLQQITPPQQKRFLDDTERRLNVLFDDLNCETIPPAIVAQLGELVKAIAARDAQAALAMHVDMVSFCSKF